MIRGAPAACALALVVAMVWAACDGGGSTPATPTAEDAVTPTPAVTAPPDVPSVEPAEVLDLAETPPRLRLVAGDMGDLRTGGASIASGDFNGDGTLDLLVGAPFADGPDNSREDAGEAYVLFGPLDGEGEVALEDEADLTMLGALPGDTMGFAVAAGDLNGDGIDDIVTGAPGSNGLTPIRTDLGEAYIVYGSSGLGGVVDLAEVEQDVTFRPAEGFTRVGTSFAIGDVNADGTDDLIAGGPFGGRVEGTPPGSPRTTNGEVYVVFGSASLPADIDVARGEGDLRLKGEEEFDSFGQGVASGDVNGDGIDDMIVTARRADGPDNSRAEAGEAYVFYGRAGISGLIGSAEADVTVYSPAANVTLGDNVTSGDLNGDGLTDFAVSARLFNGPEGTRTVAGAAYVVLGSEALPAEIDLAAGEAQATLYGRDAQDSLPVAMAIGDADGDGTADLLLCSAFADGPDNARADGGEMYAFLAGAPEGTLDLRTDVEGVLFVFAPGAGEEMGTAVHIADLDDDGSPEVVLLAPGDEGGSQRGSIYVLGLSD